MYRIEKYGIAVKIFNTYRIVRHLYCYTPTSQTLVHITSTCTSPSFYFITDKLVDITFGELLAFITGAAEVPTTGFENKLSMQFYDNEPKETRLPFTSTCSLTFSLPRGCSELSSLIIKAVKESQGFHKF